MNINWTVVVDLLRVLAWPVFAAFALFLLRRPLVELVFQLARRAQKLSVFEVSLELATLPELQPVWSIGADDVRQLTPSHIFDSASTALFEELQKPARADYVVVDLGTGREWLTSRLFIFAVVLGEVTGLRAFVFTENAGGTRRRFLGIATPTEVRRGLGQRYPWLESAFARALAAQYGIRPNTPAPANIVDHPSPLATSSPMLKYLVQEFVSNVQVSASPPPQNRGDYEELKSGTDSVWERAAWIDGDRLERDLGGPRRHGWYEFSPDLPQSLVAEAVARRDGAYVALVDRDRRFLGLVDRHALVDQLARRQIERADTSQANN